MKMSTASGYRSRSCAAPCVSMSSSTSRPTASASSSERARVPYRLPCTVAHSASSPRPSIAWNSGTPTKRKSTPSISPGRGGRVVTDTEYARSVSRSRTSRHSVVLPAPDGAETTNSVPRRLITRRAPLRHETLRQGRGLERRQDEMVAAGHDDRPRATPVGRVHQLRAALRALDESLHRQRVYRDDRHDLIGDDDVAMSHVHEMRHLPTPAVRAAIQGSAPVRAFSR